MAPANSAKSFRIGRRAASNSDLENYIMGEEERLLYEAVEKLPPKQKTVLILYYYNDMPIREIARVCGVFEGSLNQRYRFILKRKKM